MLAGCCNSTLPVRSCREWTNMRLSVLVAGQSEEWCQVGSDGLAAGCIRPWRGWRPTKLPNAAQSGPPHQIGVLKTNRHPPDTTDECQERSWRIRYASDFAVHLSSTVIRDIFGPSRQRQLCRRAGNTRSLVTRTRVVGLGSDAISGTLRHSGQSRRRQIVPRNYIISCFASLSEGPLC